MNFKWSQKMWIVEGGMDDDEDTEDDDDDNADEDNDEDNNINNEDDNKIIEENIHDYKPFAFEYGMQKAYDEDDKDEITNEKPKINKKNEQSQQEPQSPITVSNHPESN